MAGWALLLYAAYLACALGVRSWVQWRRTGSTGFKGPSGGIGSIEWMGGALLVFALAGGLLAPLLQLSGMVPAFAGLDVRAAHAAGTVLFLLGFAGTLYAQFAMGSSWRIGVDPSERTVLVNEGPFSWVRNPIFSCMIVTAVGLFLLVPNWLSLSSVVALVLGVQIQVRFVEEPYLRRTQGNRYGSYAARVGRFVPRIGRLRPPAS